MSDTNAFGQPAVTPPQTVDNQPTLEEIAAQIKAANSPQPVEPSAPVTPPVDLKPEPTDQPPSIPISTPPISQGKKVAQFLADQEIIGQSLVDEVGILLDDQSLTELFPNQSTLKERITPTLPISIIGPNGTETTITINTIDILNYLAGKTDAITAQ